MKNKLKHIAIIPARSGSKGLKDKNIKLLNGKPLLAYSIEEALNSKLFDTVMVSTDSLKYAEIAKKYGAEVPFLRSEKTSGDSASSWEMVTEVLKLYKDKERYFDTICLLQPTSPLRTADDIKRAYELLDIKNADSITSVCEVDHSPLWCNTLPSNLSMRAFINNGVDNSNRQQLEVYYRLNGAIYIRKLSYSDEDVFLYNNNTFAYIMEKNKSVDIDGKLDFDFTEFILKFNTYD